VSKVEQLEGELNSEQVLQFPVLEFIAAREAEGLSRQDVARELRLSEKYIDAIELGDFEALPSLVFARGYVRSYAKLVKLDVDRYLALFDELYGRHGKPGTVRSVNSVGRQAKPGDPVMRGSAWVFVLLLVAASVWWWKTQQGDTQAAAEMPANAPIEVESTDGSTVVVEPVIIKQESPAVLQEVSESDGVETVVDTDATANEIEDIALASQEEAVEAVVEQVQVAEEQISGAVISSSPVASDEGTLRIVFTKECWVSVEDKTGEVLAMRVKPAGSELNVTGKTPLKIHLGNSTAVGAVFFNGEPVQLDKRPGTNVVRMNLPAAE